MLNVQVAASGAAAVRVRLHLCICDAGPHEDVPVPDGRWGLGRWRRLRRHGGGCGGSPDGQPWQRRTEIIAVHPHKQANGTCVRYALHLPALNSAGPREKFIKLLKLLRA